MTSPLVQPPVPTTLLIKIYTLDVYESRNQPGGLTAAPIHESRLCRVFAQG